MKTTDRRQLLVIYSGFLLLTALSLGVQSAVLMSVALAINTVMWALSVGVLCADIWDDRRQNTNQEADHEVVPPD